MKKIKIIVFLVFFYSLSFYESYGQNNRLIDSLQTILKSSKEDTSKIKILINISSELKYNADYDYALKYGNQAVTLAKKLLASRLPDEISNRITLSLGDAFTNIGLIHQKIGDYPKALNYYLKSLNLFENISDKKGISISLINIGTVYRKMGEDSKALNYFQKALKINEEIDDKKGQAIVFNNMGNVYQKQADYKKSLFYYFKSLKIKEEIDDQRGKALTLNNIGYTYNKMKEHSIALDYLFKALEIREKIGDKLGIVGTYNNIGNVFLDQKEYSKSEAYFMKSLALAKEIGSLDDIREVNKDLTLLFEITKRPAKALAHYKAYIIARDSLYNEENTKKIVRIEMNSEFEKTQQTEKLEQEKKDVLQKEKLHRQKITTYSIGIITFLLIVFLMFLIHNNRIKQKQNKIIKEKNIELEKLSIVARETANGVFITDANGNMEWFNEGYGKLFGWTSVDEFKQKRGKNILEASGHEKIKEIIDKSVREKKSITYESINPTKDGRELWIQATLTPIFDDSGNLKKLVFVDSDITELKKTEEQLLVVNKELEAFSYSVSHDLRTPLRAINGYSKILENDYASKLDKDGVGFLNAIGNNSKKMGELIDDLLAFSKFGRMEMATSEINMTALVKAVIEEEMMGNSNEIKFITNELLPSKGTKTLIKQVWINLISNAIKYSKHKPKPSIEIGSYYKDSLVVYYIKDNGAGFDMQYYDKLFGVFQRLHSQEEFEGTGIGLAIVQKIISRHHGTVWAESKLGEGSCFYFSLPSIKL